MDRPLIDNGTLGIKVIVVAMAVISHIICALNKGFPIPGFSLSSVFLFYACLTATLFAAMIPMVSGAILASGFRRSGKIIYGGRWKDLLLTIAIINICKLFWIWLLLTRTFSPMALLTYWEAVSLVSVSFLIIYLLRYLGLKALFFFMVLPFALYIFPPFMKIFKSMHYLQGAWSLVPWFAFVMTGFILGILKGRRLYFFGAIAMLAIIVTSLCFLFPKEEALLFLFKFTSSNFYAPPIKYLIFFWFVQVLIFMGGALLFSKLPNSFFRLISPISRSVIWILAFHIPIIDVILRYFMSKGINNIYISLCSILLAYAILIIFVNYIGRLSIRLRFSRR